MQDALKGLDRSRRFLFSMSAWSSRSITSEAFDRPSPLSYPFTGIIDRCKTELLTSLFLGMQWISPSGARVTSHRPGYLHCSLLECLEKSLSTPDMRHPRKNSIERKIPSRNFGGAFCRHQIRRRDIARRSWSSSSLSFTARPLELCVARSQHCSLTTTLR